MHRESPNIQIEYIYCDVYIKPGHSGENETFLFSYTP